MCPDPFGLDLDRFPPEREAALSRGASIPFGGCSKMCLGNRVDECELRALATVLLTGWLRALPIHRTW